MANALPTISASGNGLQRYMDEIRKFPMLEPQEEYMLAKRFAEHDDTDAAHKLVTSHLRLVAKIAMGYRGYGLPIGEVMSEGNVGLMQAVKKFDPEKRLPSGNLCHVVDQSLHSGICSSVMEPCENGHDCQSKKAVLQPAQLKGKLKALEDGELKQENVEKIASTLGVSEDEVRSMNQRLSGDASLNSPIKAAEGESGQWQDWLVDESESQEATLIKQDELEARRDMLADAMDVLNEREQRIFTARRLSEDPLTLEELSGEFDISRERVRQIEVRAFEKVQKSMVNAAKELAKPVAQLEAH